MNKQWVKTLVAIVFLAILSMQGYQAVVAIGLQRLSLSQFLTSGGLDSGIAEVLAGQYILHSWGLGIALGCTSVIAIMSVIRAVIGFRKLSISASCESSEKPAELPQA